MSIKTIKNANGQVMARYVVDENDKKNGLYEEYNENGKCVRSGIYKNDKPFSGEFSGTHSNGKKWVGSYENGLKTGPWEEEEDGEIWRGKYIDNLKEGIWKMHSNDKVMRTYQRGILEGPYCEPYHQRMKHEPDGILYPENNNEGNREFEKGTYHNGKREGSFLRANILIDIRCYEDERPTEEWGYIEGVYKNGRVIHSALYSTLKYAYLGMRRPDEARFNDKGHVEVAKTSVTYDGDGNSTTRYYNNKTGANGCLKNGIKEGLWNDVIKFRHDALHICAEPLMRGNYINGKKVGKWEVPFSRFYVTYQNNKPNGPFRMQDKRDYWYVGQMKDGNYDGVCKVFLDEARTATELYENGKLLERTEYQDDQKVAHSKLCPEIGDDYLYEKFEKGKLAETYFLYGPTPDSSRVPDTKHVYYNTDGSVRQVCYTAQYGKEISEQEWLAKHGTIHKIKKNRNKFKAQLAERAFEKRADKEDRDQTAQEIKKIRSNIGTATTKMARSLLQHSAKKVAEEFHTQKANVPRRTALKFKTGKEDR